MTVTETLEARLRAAFAPERLVVEDDSARHAGHAGSRPEGETHFRVVVVAAGFAGKSRVERGRMVHEAVADLMASRIHALSITAKAPGEG